MQTRFKDGSVMVVGCCSKNAELEYVGDSGKRLCKLGLTVGKRADGSTIWANVQAWHDAAEVLSMAKKGQQVLVIGQLKFREYNGKTYTDLVADYVSVCAPTAQNAAPTDYASLAGDFRELPDNDDEQSPF